MSQIMRMWVSLFLVSLSGHLSAQLYQYYPTSTYSAEIAMEEYSVHQVNIIPSGNPDFYMMAWRLVGNTCPTEWEFQLCDWATCFEGMPNTAIMDTIFSGGHGLLKPTVNPFTTPGSGQLTFWVFPEGEMDAYEELTFFFQTDVVGVNSVDSSKPYVYPNPANDFVNLNHFTLGQWHLKDVAGRSVQTIYLDRPEQRLDVSNLPAGFYSLVQGDQRIAFIHQ